MIYWSDYGRGTIERANMDDGSNREVLIDSGLWEPFGMAIDFKSELRLIIQSIYLVRIQFQGAYMPSCQVMS